MLKFLTKRRDEALRLRCLEIAVGDVEWAEAMYQFIKTPIDLPKGTE